MVEQQLLQEVHDPLPASKRVYRKRQDISVRSLETNKEPWVHVAESMELRLRLQMQCWAAKWYFQRHPKICLDLVALGSFENYVWCCLFHSAGFLHFSQGLAEASLALVAMMGERLKGGVVHARLVEATVCFEAEARDMHEVANCTYSCAESWGRGTGVNYVPMLALSPAKAETYFFFSHQAYRRKQRWRKYRWEISRVRCAE